MFNAFWPPRELGKAIGSRGGVHLYNASSRWPGLLGPLILATASGLLRKDLGRFRLLGLLNGGQQARFASSDGLRDMARCEARSC